MIKEPDMFWGHLVTTALEVHLNQLKSPSTLRAESEKRLIKTIRDAGKNVPYYRDSFRKAGINPDKFKGSEDLKKIPFLTKSDVRNAFPDRIVADGVDLEKCHYSATTGSTGKSLPFIYSMKTFAFYLSTNLRVYTMAGYKPWYNCCYIKYTAMDPVNIGPFLRFHHIPSVAPIEDQIRMLKKHKPDFIDGYASIIYEISRRMTPEDLKIIRPKMILCNSEMSTVHQRNAVSEVFKCPVYDEYSTEETWMVASLCKKQRYHLFTDNVWVEFLDSDGNEVKPGEPGEMVLTSLRSPAMPFIRYKIGDIGRMSTTACDCGSPFPVLEAFEGRSDDSFILPDGTFVSSLKILNTFTMFINKYLHLMEEFRVIQETKDRVVIELVKGKEYTDIRFNEVLEALSNLFKNQVTITVNPVDSIDLKGKIKRKAIESRVTGQQ